MPLEIPRSLECNGRLPPPPAPPPPPHPTPAAPHPPGRGKRRGPRFGTWRWCRRPPKPSTRTPCGKIPPKSAAVCPCLTRLRAPSPGGCWRLQQRIRLTAAAVLAGVGGRVRRLPRSSRRPSSVAGRPASPPLAWRQPPAAVQLLVQAGRHAASPPGASCASRGGCVGAGGAASHHQPRRRRAARRDASVRELDPLGGWRVRAGDARRRAARRRKTGTLRENTRTSSSDSPCSSCSFLLFLRTCLQNNQFSNN